MASPSLLRVALVSVCFLGLSFADKERNVTLEEAILEQEAIEDEEGHRALTRKRRYLIYPEGSSMQVVFCLTAGTYIGIADIFYMGATASLAWELPTDPYHPFRHKFKEAESKMDTLYSNEINNDYTLSSSEHIPMYQKNTLVDRFTGEPIQPFAKENYLREKYEMQFRRTGRKMNRGNRKRIISNPAFAKRSASRKDSTLVRVDREAMHSSRSDRDFLNPKEMDWRTVDYHRSSRSSLYVKIEKLLKGMGNEGRDCVLKSLCEIGQGGVEGQGSFLDEIMRAIFTLHPGKEFQYEEEQGYDKAFNNKGSCSKEFNKCTRSIKSIPLR